MAWCAWDEYVSEYQTAGEPVNSTSIFVFPEINLFVPSLHGRPGSFFKHLDHVFKPPLRSGSVYRTMVRSRVQKVVVSSPRELKNSFAQSGF